MVDAVGRMAIRAAGPPASKTKRERIARLSNLSSAPPTARMEPRVARNTETILPDGEVFQLPARMSPMASAEKACSRCNGSGWILHEDGGQRFARECECRRSGARIAKWRTAGVPERYQDCSFRTLNEVAFESRSPNPSLPAA